MSSKKKSATIDRLEEQRIESEEQEEGGEPRSPILEFSSPESNGHENGTALAIPDLSVFKSDLSYDEWAAFGIKFGEFRKKWQFIVAEWVLYGEGRWGERASQYINDLGLDLHTIQNAISVAKVIEPSRRREELSFDHHSAVAGVKDAAGNHDAARADALLAQAVAEGWTSKELRQKAKDPKPIPPAGSAPAKAAPLLRFCPPDWTTAQIVAAILRVSFPDAHTALDATYGNGAFWDGSAHVTVQGVDSEPSRAPNEVADFRQLPYDDESYDVVTFDPPHLADGGEDSIMAERFGTYTDDELRDVVSEGVTEVWRVARLGIIVKVTDYVHGQEFVPMSDWVREQIGLGEHRVPYEVVYQTREHAMIDSKWGEQCSAYNNGATYLVFRKGDQTHKVRRDLAPA